MTDVQIHSLVLSLEIIKVLMADTPGIYADMEHAALTHVFRAGEQRQLSMSELTNLLRCTAQETADKMAAVRVRLNHES
jgi:hypothetical protein